MKKGFTLVELLIGAMLGAIILMSVYVVFNVATKYWSKGNSVVSATQTARYAFDHMSRNLKMAVIDEGKYYSLTTSTVSTVTTQVLSAKKGDGSYMYYEYVYDSSAATGKIYFYSGTDTPVYMPLTGTEESAAGNKIQILPAGDNHANGGIFSNDGSVWQYTGTDLGIVYIDFIAQDSSAKSAQQTAHEAPEVEIRTAVTYPHF